MRLFDLFDSRDKKRRLSHIKSLIVLASSDGNLSPSELNLISKIAARIDLTPEELKRIIERPESISFEIPSNFSEKIEQLYDMIMVMMVDAEIHENEIAFCKLISIKLGFRHQIIDKMIEDIIDMIAEGFAINIVLSNLGNKYN